MMRAIETMDRLVIIGAQLVDGDTLDNMRRAAELEDLLSDDYAIGRAYHMIDGTVYDVQLVRANEDEQLTKLAQIAAAFDQPSVLVVEGESRQVSRMSVGHSICIATVEGTLKPCTAADTEGLSEYIYSPIIDQRYYVDGGTNGN